MIGHRSLRSTTSSVETATRILMLIFSVSTMIVAMIRPTSGFSTKSRHMAVAPPVAPRMAPLTDGDGRSRKARRMSPSKLRPSVRMMSSSYSEDTKGKLLVLGGTGFLGQTICRRALLEGYKVTSLSRRGRPSADAKEGSSRSSGVGSSSSSSSGGTTAIDYRQGDARQLETIARILDEGSYVGVIHCVGLLLDDASGLGTYNRLVSGSGSVPDENSTYDTITRLSAFNAIDASMDYWQRQHKDGAAADRLPFVFTSAAEAGWPDVAGGPQIEEYLAPDWLRRYLTAKRAVEGKLMDDPSVRSVLRPVIFRPSLLYSLDRPASYVSVGAFFIGNRLGLPFVDRPVTVQSLANAVVRSLSRESVEGVLRYSEIEALNQ